MRIRFPFSRWPKAALPSSTPDGWRIFAIGDVHGCIDQLNRLLDGIEIDLRRHGARGHLVFLGDLVDRGPASAAIIDRVKGGLPGEKASFLMGNHEEVLLACYDGDLRKCGEWLQYGGLQTLESYGLSRTEIFERAADLPAAIREVIPREHVSFIRTFADQVALGDYLFVHAGIRPGVAFRDQSPKDLRWIRRGFLDNPTDHGAVVVHGHSIVKEIEVHRNRIAIDTGCYLTGKLTALVLEGTSKGQLVVSGRDAASYGADYGSLANASCNA